MKPHLPARGFSLLESVLALGLLVVILLGLLSAFQSSTQLGRHARERTHAAATCASVLEEVAASDWDDLLGHHDATFAVYLDPAAERYPLQPPPGRDAVGHVAVVDLEPGLRRVEVSALWQTTQDSTLRVRYQTLLARDP